MAKTDIASAGGPPEDWVAGLDGYSLRLFGYTPEGSRLALRGSDRIAARPGVLLVFHDVSYIEMPLTTGKIRAREATDQELERVRRALGRNFRASNVLALAATERRVFLIEYGYVQWLEDPR